MRRRFNRFFCGLIVRPVHRNNDLIRSVQVFGYQFIESRKRMIAICQDNSGNDSDKNKTCSNCNAGTGQYDCCFRFFVWFSGQASVDQVVVDFNNSVVYHLFIHLNSPQDTSSVSSWFLKAYFRHFPFLLCYFSFFTIHYYLFSACEWCQSFTEAKRVDGFIEGLLEFLRFEMITDILPCGEEAVAVPVEIRSKFSDLTCLSGELLRLAVKVQALVTGPGL